MMPIGVLLIIFDLLDTSKTFNEVELHITDQHFQLFLAAFFTFL